MRPSPFVEAMEARRHDGEARRHADERALREVRPERPSVAARLAVATLRVVRRDKRHRSSRSISLADAVLIVSAGPGARITTADPDVLAVAQAEGIATVALPGEG